MDVNQELVTKEEINSTWTDMEIELLRDSLEDIRKKGGCLGLYGLSDKQARYCKERIKTKTVNQIKGLYLIVYTVMIDKINDTRFIIFRRCIRECK